MSCGDALDRDIVGIVEDMVNEVFPNHASWEFVVCVLGLIEEVNKEFEAAKLNGKEEYYYSHYQETVQSQFVNF